jgi:hypothetical protein
MAPHARNGAGLASESIQSLAPFGTARILGNSHKYPNQLVQLHVDRQ